MSEKFRSSDPYIRRLDDVLGISERPDNLDDYLTHVYNQAMGRLEQLQNGLELADRNADGPDADAEPWLYIMLLTRISAVRELSQGQDAAAAAWAAIELGGLIQQISLLSFGPPLVRGIETRVGGRVGREATIARSDHRAKLLLSVRNDLLTKGRKRVSAVQALEVAKKRFPTEFPEGFTDRQARTLLKGK